MMKNKRICLEFQKKMQRVFTYSVMNGTIGDVRRGSRAGKMMCGNVWS
jgi:hypothetical protein